MKKKLFFHLRVTPRTITSQDSREKTIYQNVNANKSQFAGSVSDNAFMAGTVNIANYYYKGNPDTKLPICFKCPHNIPASKALKFIGRDSEILKLHERLERQYMISIINAKGKIGVGKTELARQYALKYLEHFYDGGIIWLVSHKKIEDQVIEFLDNQVMPDLKLKHPEFNFPENIDICRKIDMFWKLWPEEGKQVLIVIDAVTDKDGFIELLPLIDKRFKILTTSEVYLGSPFHSMELDTLYSEDSLSILNGLILNHFSSDPKEFYIKQVCELVGHSPKALYLIAPFLGPGKLP